MNNNLKITADEGYWFGLGAFETIWVYKNKAVFIEEHLDRLKNAVFYLNIVQEPIDQWIDKRKKEIEKYILTLNINDEFELYDASETFRNIPMTKEGKPNVNRAKLGRLFGQSIGKKPFENVERVYIANGNVKKSRYNKATMFKRTK